MFSDQAAKTYFSISYFRHVLNKAIEQDSDQTAQTFSSSKVYAVRTLSRDYQADNPCMSYSDWAVGFWYQLYLRACWCEFPCLLHRKNLLVSGQLSRSINYSHGRRGKVL